MGRAWKTAAGLVACAGFATATAVAGTWDDANTITVTTNEQLREITSERIPPGVTLLIAPGNYAGDLTLREPRGTEGEPILIAAADPKRPPVISGGGAAFHIVRPAYFELRDLVLEGATANGINIDDGGDVAEPTAAHAVTLKNLVVRDM